MSKNEFISYLESISLVLSAFLFIVFPSFFITITSDVFIVPKQLFVIFAAIVLTVLFLARIIAEGKITIRSTPFNLPVLLFGIAVLVSAVFSRHLYDSLYQAVPLFALVVMYFTLTNLIKDKMSFKLLLYSLVLGAILSSLITVLHYFKIYIFPFPETQISSFNTFGAPIQQVLYSLPVLLISVFHLMNFKRSRVINYDLIVFTISTVFITASSVLVMYQILVSQGLVMLPYVYGFQIALAAISQDAQRLLQSFLMGSGYGTFVTDFTRFKLASINLDKNIWNVIFSYSSSYFLELLATTGILGAAAYFFLIAKSFKTKLNTPNVYYVAILVIFFVSFILPLSYSVLFLLFCLLSLYSSYLYLEKSHYVENVTVTLVALRQGLINFVELGDSHRKTESRALPVVVSAVILIILGFVGYSALRFTIADAKFRDSLVMVAQNNGQDAYRLQTEAISAFPYRSDYYRFFSQLNLALATSLAGTLPQDPSQANSDTANRTRQTILTLIQQSITSARTSVMYSPNTSANWQNMAQIYRSLINVGQNAEQFSIASLQQAVRLDPYNPQLYIELGGIYYQLGQYELAQNQFQLAVGLKRDFANAYYNLGHALEAKGDLNNALVQYQSVKSLVGRDQQNLDKISAEIKALEEKIGEKAGGETANLPEASTNQPPLEINQPEASLPAQKPPVKIPEPPTTVSPSPKVSPSISPTIFPSPTSRITPNL